MKTPHITITGCATCISEVSIVLHCSVRFRTSTVDRLEQIGLNNVICWGYICNIVAHCSIVAHGVYCSS